MRGAYENIADRLTDLHVWLTERPLLVVVGAAAVTLVVAGLLLTGGGSTKPTGAEAGAGFVTCSDGYCLRGVEAPESCAPGRVCKIKILGTRPATAAAPRIELGGTLTTNGLTVEGSGATWTAEGSFRCLAPAPPVPVSVRIAGEGSPRLLTSKATIECAA